MTNPIDLATGRLSQAELERIELLPLDQMGAYLETYVSKLAGGLIGYATAADALELRDELHDLGERYLRRFRVRIQEGAAQLESSEETNRLLKREAIDVSGLRSAIRGIEELLASREKLIADLMQILTDAAEAVQ